MCHGSPEFEKRLDFRCTDSGTRHCRFCANSEGRGCRLQAQARELLPAMRYPWALGPSAGQREREEERAKLRAKTQIVRSAVLCARCGAARGGEPLCAAPRSPRLGGRAGRAMAARGWVCAARSSIGEETGRGGGERRGREARGLVSLSRSRPEEAPGALVSLALPGQLRAGQCRLPATREGSAETS